MSTFCNDGHVTILNSRSSLPASALCAVCRQLAFNVAENFGRFLAVYRPVEWLWINSNGKMETRYPIEGGIIVTWSRKMLNKKFRFLRFNRNSLKTSAFASKTHIPQYGAPNSDCTASLSSARRPPKSPLGAAAVTPREPKFTKMGEVHPG